MLAITFCLLICFGDNKPVTVSDFCELTRREIAQLQALSPDELAHLQRPRKNAIASLRRSFKRHCPTNGPTEQELRNDLADTKSKLDEARRGK